MDGVLLYGLSKSSSEDNLTDAEVSGYRFQPQKLTPPSKKLPEMVSTGGGAEPICRCGDRSLSAVLKWLQLGNARSVLMIDDKLQTGAIYCKHGNIIISNYIF